VIRSIEKMCKKLSQAKVNLYDEYSIIKEFKKEIKKERIEILNYSKIEGENRPDFKCSIKDAHEEKEVFIEITKLLSAEGNIQNKNIANKRISSEIKEILEKKGYNGDILITLNSYDIKREKNFIDLLVNFLENKLGKNFLPQNLYIKNEEIKSFNSLLAHHIQWIFIKKINFLSIEINPMKIDPRFLSQRVLESIKKKEEKNYHEIPVWLIIYIDDGISTPDDIIKIENISSKKCERVYIQLNYWSETQNYPLFRIA